MPYHADPSDLTNYRDQYVQGSLAQQGDLVQANVEDGTCASVVVSGTFTGTLAVDASHDNGASWVQGITLVDSSGTTRTTITASGTYQVFDLGAASQIRVRATSAMTGTALAFLRAAHGSQYIPPANLTFASAALNQGAPAEYANAWPSVITDGEGHGNAPAYPLSVDQVGHSATNIATATTTTVKASAGTLHGVAVNSGGAGSTAAIYDGDHTGTLLATVDTSTRGNVLFGVAFTTALTIVTANGVAANITAVWS